MNSSLHLALRNVAVTAIGVAVTCLWIGLLAAPAFAAWPGRDGAIAFVRGPHIWVQLPSGKERQLTDGTRVADADPAFLAASRGANPYLRDRRPGLYGSLVRTPAATPTTRVPPEQGVRTP